MAKNKNSLNFAPFREVIQLPLSDSMGDEVVEWLADLGAIDAQLDAYVMSGMAIRVAPKPEGEYGASAQVLDPSNVNKGLMVFGNGPTPSEAKAVLVVKLGFLAKVSDWTTVASSGTKKKYH